MLTVVIPMAGAGSRFAQEGYTLPKPFIDVNGRMMIERVLDGVAIPNARYVLVIQQKFFEENKLQLEQLSAAYPVTYVAVKQLTQGASCTALAAHKHFNEEDAVVFVDSDNIFDNAAFIRFIEDAQQRNLDGSLLTFSSTDARFSFAEVDENGFVLRTREKEAISSHAIAGAYYFARGEQFVDCTIEMLIYGDKAKNEFYISNVYNYAVDKRMKIGVFDIADSDWDCVGTPEQLKRYVER